MTEYRVRIFYNDTKEVETFETVNTMEEAMTIVATLKAEDKEMVKRGVPICDCHYLIEVDDED